MKLSVIARKLFRYFLQGLIILAPITITLWAVLSLFNWVDSILPDFIHRLFPKLALDENGNPRHIPGLGFILVTGIVLIVGYVSSSFIVSKLVDGFFADSQLGRDLVHGDGPDAVTHKQVGRFL